MRKACGNEILPYRAVGLAAIAGLRSMAALLSRAVRRGELEDLQDTPFAALAYPKVSATLQQEALCP